MANQLMHNCTKFKVLSSNIIENKNSDETLIVDNIYEIDKVYITFTQYIYTLFDDKNKKVNGKLIFLIPEGTYIFSNNNIQQNITLLEIIIS
jgi:hypothetical protein